MTTDAQIAGPLPPEAARGAEPSWLPAASAEVVYLLRQNPITLLGLAIVGAMVVMAILAPVIAPYDPLATDPANALMPPSRAHWMGTDEFGEDIWSRVIWGARIDLSIAFGAVGIALVVGCTIGALAGFAGGWADEVAMRAMDVLQAFPSFILAMGVAAALGPSLRNLIISVALINVAVYARLMRSRMLIVKSSLYASAAASSGNPRWRLLLVHLVPNCLSPIFVQSTLQAGWAILTAAGLSFIGLGVPVPEPEWGVMVAMGAPRITSGDWWVSFFPGLFIAITVMSANLIGDGLQDLLDPRRR